MSPVEICAYVAFLAFFLYARTQTHLAKQRWGIVYSVFALFFVFWLVRIAHLLIFGPDR